MIGQGINPTLSSKTGKSKEKSSAEPAPVGEMIRLLRAAHPNAQCDLHYETPLQLLIATILSAQCTDEQVNKVTPQLFEQFPTAADYAAAERYEIEAIVRPTGFYRQKAKFIQETCRIIVDLHSNEIPANMNDMTQLPGVARKTANIVLGEIFGIAEGIAVDTYVHRVANRLGLSDGKNAVKVESDLMKVVPQEAWIDISHLLMFHGRRVCTARKPQCAACKLKQLCPSARS